MQNLSEEELEEAISAFEEEFIDPTFEIMLSKISADEQKDIYTYMELHSELDEIWQKTMVVSEYMFRAASIRMAECYSQAEGDGNTYMYLFDKKHSDYECIGACHALELPYVFHNLERDDFSGTIDETLADKVCAAWVNFAKTGNPSTDEDEWTQYDITNRNTMVINNDCTLTMVSDPMSEERILTSCFACVYLSGGYGY